MGSKSCAKRCVLLFDLISVLLALVLIAFSVYVFFTYETDDVVSVTLHAYFGVGLATLMIVFFGCIGKLRESVCCTVTFIVLMSILIIAQAAVVFILTRGQSTVASNMANTLDEAWEEELLNPGAMTHYENWFNCCGRASPQDYIVNELLPPPSCYKNGNASEAGNLITRGCRIEFEDYWKSLFMVVNAVAWCLIAVQLFDSIVSCVLCNSIRNEHRRSYF